MRSLLVRIGASSTVKDEQSRIQTLDCGFARASIQIVLVGRKQADLVHPCLRVRSICACICAQIGDLSGLSKVIKGRDTYCGAPKHSMPI